LEQYHRRHKYLDLTRWYPKAVQLVIDLDIHLSSKPLKILDLGSGAGLFLFVCKNLGHKVLGLDIDIEPIYAEVFELLNLPPRVIHQISKFKPLPEFTDKFDIITSFMVCFNNWFEETPWGVKEWDFLLKDISRHLSKNGRVIFSLNRNTYGKIYTDELKELFLQKGAILKNNFVYFPAKGKLNEK